MPCATLPNLIVFPTATGEISNFDGHYNPNRVVSPTPLPTATHVPCGRPTTVPIVKPNVPATSIPLIILATCVNSPANALPVTDSQFAFVASCDNDQTHSIYLADDTFTKYKQVPNTSGGFSPSLSPDGQQIAFSGAGGLNIINRDGSGARVIGDGGGHVSWSPNGKYLASTNSTLNVYNTDGTNVIGINNPIASTDGFGNASWSPDSQSLVYVGSHDVLTPGQIYIININSGVSTPIVIDPAFFVPPLAGLGMCSRKPERVLYPSWSPDGKYIAVLVISRLVFDPGIGCDLFYGDYFSVFIIYPDGSRKTELDSFADSSGYPDSISWSPDSQQIVLGKVEDALFGSAFFMQLNDPTYGRRVFFTFYKDVDGNAIYGDRSWSHVDWKPALSNDLSCKKLYDDLSKQTQPFGPQLPNATPPFTQPEIAYSPTLHYYPDYHQADPSNPDALLGYADKPGSKPVPCIFTTSQGNPMFDGRGNPIIRFGGPDMDLRLLNYASHFAFLSQDWCAPAKTPLPDGQTVVTNDPGDNVFDTPDQQHIINPWPFASYADRSVASVYRAGYNVPPVLVNCSTGNPNSNSSYQVVGGSADGPCATLVASVFRAMHLFTPGGYTDYPPFTASDYQTGEFANDLSNVYYGVVGQKNTLVSSVNGGSRVYSRQYLPLSVYFLNDAGKRSYADSNQAIDSDDNKTLVGGKWGYKSLYLLGGGGAGDLKVPYHGPITDPTLRWQSIGPGDLVVNVIEAIPGGSQPENTKLPPIPNNISGFGIAHYTHIQVVVGWGPKSYMAYTGLLYSSFEAIPNGQQQNYVPYTIDRGEGGSTATRPNFVIGGDHASRGLKPFTYFILASRADFWIVD